jgi:hypothetical protein
MDEQPVPLSKETRRPLPAAPGHPEGDDAAYERHGTATICRVTEPLSGGRTASVRAHKTAIDWATEVKHRLATQYPEADRIRLVGDKLHPHGLGARYEAFPPEQARARAARLELHHPPQHGSGLHRAEIERRARTRQCLDRRMPALATRRAETKQWEQRRNASQQGVDWQFSPHEARIQLKRLYPPIHS